MGANVGMYYTLNFIQYLSCAFVGDKIKRVSTDGVAFRCLWNQYLVMHTLAQITRWDQINIVCVFMPVVLIISLVLSLFLQKLIIFLMNLQKLIWIISMLPSYILCFRSLDKRSFSPLGKFGAFSPETMQ